MAPRLAYVRDPDVRGTPIKWTTRTEFPMPDSIHDQSQTTETKPDFDPDLSPEHFTNRKAARARNLAFDRRKRAYVDADGCMIRDRFGQPL